MHFFNLLRAITNACFPTLFAMSPGQLKLVIDSIVWAFRHTERNVADTGLNLLLELLLMFSRSEYATQFHQTYYLQLMQEIFAVMTGARSAYIFLLLIECAQGHVPFHYACTAAMLSLRCKRRTLCPSCSIVHTSSMTALQFSGSSAVTAC